MQKRIVLITMVAAMLMAGSTAMAAPDHVVSVEIQAISSVSVDAPVALVINDDTYTATDNTTADLSWSTNGTSGANISVTADVVPAFSFTVEAVGEGGGAITLTTGVQTLITGVAAETTSCDLEFIALADAADPPQVATDYTLTYTIAAN